MQKYFCEKIDFFHFSEFYEASPTSFLNEMFICSILHKFSIFHDAHVNCVANNAFDMITTHVWITGEIIFVENVELCNQDIFDEVKVSE